MVQTFSVNDVNELSNADDAGTLTVVGTAGEPSDSPPYSNNPGVTNIVVNGQSADIYADGTFAATGFSPADGQDTYTAIAQDNIGRASTNSVTINVSSSSDYTYDLNGNLASDGTRNFAYNDENQLVGVWVANAWSNSFAYDGFMRKRIEQDFAWNGSGWTETNEVHYIYDGNLVLQERDGNNEPLTTYTRGVDLSGTLDGAGGIGGLLARSDNQKIVPALLTPEYPNPQNVVTSYYFSDADGNVTALVSPSGMLLAQYEYDPFGNLISKSGLMADVNKYRFSSKEWERNAGLYYYGYRFYDPNLQRWVNRDPFDEPGFETLQLANQQPFTPKLPLGINDAETKFLLGMAVRSANLDAPNWPPELLECPNLNLFDFVANDSVNDIDPFGLRGGRRPPNPHPPEPPPTQVQDTGSLAADAGGILCTCGMIPGLQPLIPIGIVIGGVGCAIHMGGSIAGK